MVAKSRNEWSYSREKVGHVKIFREAQVDLPLTSSEQLLVILLLLPPFHIT